MEESRRTLTYAQETAKLEFASDLHAFMERQEISQKSLAECIGKSEAHVSKCLRGDKNLTIDSIVELVHACGGKAHLRISQEGNTIRWLEMLAGGRPRSSSTGQVVDQWAKSEAKTCHTAYEADHAPGHPHVHTA